MSARNGQTASYMSRSQDITIAPMNTGPKSKRYSLIDKEVRKKQTDVCNIARRSYDIADGFIEWIKLNMQLSVTSIPADNDEGIHESIDDVEIIDFLA